MTRAKSKLQGLFASCERTSSGSPRIAKVASDRHAAPGWSNIIDTPTNPRQRPRRLHPGDTVAVVAPAGPVRDELLDAGLQHLESWGLDVKLGEHVRDRHPRLDYLAGDDIDRAADLQQAWCDPAIDGILCARGGYGGMRMLRHLDWQAMATATPTVFVGSSDVTALHDAFSAQLGITTLFGPMIGTTAFAHDERAREHLKKTLFSPDEVMSITNTAASPLVPGRTRGLTYGGNLSLVAGALGTPDEPAPPVGGIALLEDITEEPYRLDRFVTQLLRAGWFDHASGIALGSWVDCGPPEDVKAMLYDLLGKLKIPIIWELGFGHCDGQFTVPLGVPAELDADQARLSFLEPALR